MTDPDFASLVYEVRSCTICKSSQPPLPHAPNPVFQFGWEARVLIAGQAPGNLADKTQKPFNDPSGVRLRNWLNISPETFYDPGRVAILPMGFCFPGYDRKRGDLPPRKGRSLPSHQT